MFSSLPASAHEIMDWEWPQIEPYFEELESRQLSADNVTDWLADWSGLADLIAEVFTRRYVAKTVDTTSREIEQAYFKFLEEIHPPVQKAEQSLKMKLLDSGLQVEGFEVPLRKMRAATELFREANLPLQTEEEKLGAEYDKLMGAQSVQWDGEEVTIEYLNTVYQSPDRARREKAWRLATQRELADREAINDNWVKLLKLRQEMAANAGMPDYRAFRWQQLKRFDYTPDDCIAFHEAIEQVVVPAATRIYKKHRDLLSVESLRPWDTNGGSYYSLPSRHQLAPFTAIEDLKSKTGNMLNKLNPQLGKYFDVMRREDLLDLGNRKGKAPGGYNLPFDNAQRPFIFMNAVGIHDDIQTLLHEAGHAFHVFESAGLPYHWQRTEEAINAEFAEVASMAMELLAGPYLSARRGGFYSEQDAAHARIQHLETMILFWPYMAVVDAFQHWVYTHPDAAADPANCDAQWGQLWERFIPRMDWSGLDDELVTGWHLKLHIHRIPFYYVEYGLAQLGAVQVWANAMQDETQAVATYRNALALGGTQPLPQLFEAAGAKLAFDADTLREAVELIEKTIAALEDA